MGFLCRDSYTSTMDDLLNQTPNSKLQIHTGRLHCDGGSRQTTLHSLADAAGLIDTNASDLSVRPPWSCWSLWFLFCSGCRNWDSPNQGNLGWTNWSILVIYGDFLYLSSPWDTQWPCSYVKTLFWNDSCILLLFFLRVRVFMSKPYFGLMFVECVFLCHTMSKPNLDAIAGLSGLLSEDQ